MSLGPLTVVTLTQKTKNDMSGWSEGVECEREELVAFVSRFLKCSQFRQSVSSIYLILSLQFIDAAKQICEQLQDSGFWCDFIDPTSGRPYLGDLIFCPSEITLSVGLIIFLTQY